MDYLSVILILILTILLTLNYLSLSKRTSAMEIVNKMGIGYNLANLFDNYDPEILILKDKIYNPDDIISLYGSQAPTKQMIKNIKKYGFKTIRFPVTWMYFTDDLGNIDSKWMSRVKEVVNWIINLNMFCILTVYSDTHQDNDRMGIDIDKYYNLWIQISEEFKDYNEYLIFESMDEGACYVDYITHSYSFDYDKFLVVTQTFIDIVRKSGSYNLERLLIIAGMASSIEYTCINEFKIPIDKYNKIAISFHYFEPISFTKEIYELRIKKEWGNNEDYNELMNNFEKIKKYFIDKGYPVILNEIGVPVNQLKDNKSIREYLYSIFALSNQNGIIPCLWDTSTKNIDLCKIENCWFSTISYYSFFYNYYNRETDKWYDEKIKNIFIHISNKKYINLYEFYKVTKNVTYYKEKGENQIVVNFGDNKKIVNIIINAYILNRQHIYEKLFEILCDLYNNPYKLSIIYKIKYYKKQYDGTFYIYLTDIDERCYFRIYFYEATKSFIYNNITIEYNEELKVFDYNSYQKLISSYIN